MSLKQNDEYNEKMFDLAVDLLDKQESWTAGEQQTFLSIPLEIRIQAIKEHNGFEVEKDWALNYNV